MLQGASIALIVTLNKCINGVVHYTWILLTEAGSHDFGGLMVLVHQVRGDKGELVRHMLNMLQHRVAVHLICAHFDHSR